MTGSNQLPIGNHRPMRSEQLHLAKLIRLRHPGEKILIHHVTEDSPVRLVLEVERRHPRYGCTFDRITL